MPTPRVVQIPVPVEVTPATTHFNLRFNTDGSTTWTDFFTSGATLEDLNVSLLSGGEYTLDGVNSPTGNEAAASYAGNWYQRRLKSASGYGDWSVPFKVPTDASDDDGPVSDAATLQDDFADLKIALDFPTQEETDEYLTRALVDAMRSIRTSASIEALYVDDDRTAAQTQGLQLVERKYAMVGALRKAARMKALGMHAPLLMEESADILAVAEDLKDEADGLLAGITEGAGGVANVQYLHPFSDADERIFARDVEW